MEKKTALLFVIDDSIKVVFGETLKVVKFQAMSLDYNVRFFDKLFDEWEVIVVEKAGPLDKQGLFDFVAQMGAKPPAPARRESASAVVRPQQAAPRTMTLDDDCMLFRFIGQSIITVEDVPSHEDFPGMPGVKQTLVLKPDQAVNLRRYDPERVRTSPTLRRLIQRGSLVPCTPEEADELIVKADIKQKAETNARFDRAARMVPADMKAEDYADRIRRGASLMPDDDIETIEVTAEAPRVSASGPKTAEEMLEISSNLSTDQLMRLAGASEDSELPPMEEQPRRQLAPRPVVEPSGIAGRATRRLM